MVSQAKFKNFILHAVKFINYLNDFRDYKDYEFFDKVVLEQNIFAVDFVKPDGSSDPVVLKLSDLKKSYEDWEHAKTKN